MQFALLLIALGNGAPAGGDAQPKRVSPTGFLYQPSFSIDYELREPCDPYCPQPGDIYLATEDWFLARFGHLTVFSGAPHHSGIVFAMPDGRMALMEGGPDSTLYIRILDLIPQMTHYTDTKRVWIRQRRVPLTPEQSRRLTAFCLAAADRPFALTRMVKERSPFRAKGRLRTPLIGRPHAADFNPDNPEPSMRNRYFCSELVTEACVAAGLLDPRTTRPMSMYPRELYFGSSRIPYVRNHLDMSEWAPPARWTLDNGSQANMPRRPFIDGDTGTIRRGP